MLGKIKMGVFSGMVTPLENKGASKGEGKKLEKILLRGGKKGG